jgi:hypothetical protein
MEGEAGIWTHGFEPDLATQGGDRQEAESRMEGGGGGDVSAGGMGRGGELGGKIMTSFFPAVK